jgi:hypothetical protein
VHGIHKRRIRVRVQRCSERMDACRSGALYGGEHALALGCTLATVHSVGEGEATFQ